MKQLTLKEKQNMWALSWRDHRKEADFRKLMKSCDGLVVSCAFKVKRWSKLELEDLKAEGYRGIMRACDEYDPERGDFSACAYTWIRYYVEYYARWNWSLVRIPDSSKERKLHAKIGGLVFNYENEGWSTTRAIELAAADLGASPREASKAIGIKNGAVGLAAETDDENEWGVHLETEAPSAEKEYDAVCVQEIINECMKSLSKIEREIITRYWLSPDPETFREVAEKMGVSRQMIGRKAEKAMDKLRDEMRRRGFKLEDLL